MKLWALTRRITTSSTARPPALPLARCAGVQFGTGSGRETQHAHLRDFYRAVDRGVCELLHSIQAPLVLAGVDEDVAIYRSISAYPNLLEQGIHGSPGAFVSPAQILQHAHDIALFSFQKRVANEMAEAKERLAPGRFSTDLDGILRAAVEGRVSDLYLDESGRRMGTFAAKVFGGHTNWHDEDLLNVAALGTLLRGGAVYSLPTHCMPAGAVAAAAFSLLRGSFMKILAAVDSSQASVIAAREAAARLWPAGTTVHVISVVEPIIRLDRPRPGRGAPAIGQRDGSMHGRVFQAGRPGDHYRGSDWRSEGRDRE